MVRINVHDTSRKIKRNFLPVDLIGVISFFLGIILFILTRGSDLNEDIESNSGILIMSAILVFVFVAGGIYLIILGSDKNS